MNFSTIRDFVALLYRIVPWRGVEDRSCARNVCGYFHGCPRRRVKLPRAARVAAAALVVLLAKTGRLPVPRRQR
jgi:hypothetical protein